MFLTLLVLQINICQYLANIHNTSSDLSQSPHWFGLIGFYKINIPFITLDSKTFQAGLANNICVDDVKALHL